jgi:CHAT domain-containing protein
MASDSSSSTLTGSSISAMLDALLATKTWTEAFQLLREHSDVLLTEDACADLRQRIARLRQRHVFWRRRRWRRQLRSWQSQLDILEDARASGVEEAVLNFYLTQLKQRNPLMRIFLEQIEQYPEMHAALRAAVQGMLNGQDAQQIFTSRMGYPDSMAALAQDQPAFQEYADRLRRKLVKARSPQAMARVQEMLGAALEGAQLEGELIRLNELEDAEPGITAEDLAERRILLAQEFRQRIEKIGEPLLAAVTSTEVARALYDAQSGDISQAERQAILEQCVSLLERAIPMLRRHRLRLTWGMAQELLSNVYERLNAITGRHKRQAIAALRRGISAIDRRRDPDTWVSLQHDLGVAYLSGWRSVADQEHAIQAYRRALAVRTEDDDLFRAWVHLDLGTAFLERHKGNRRRSLEKAVEYFDKALKALETLPESLIIFNWIYPSRARALEQLGRLAEAHESLIAGRKLSDLFFERSNTFVGLTGGAYTGIVGIHLQDVQILLQMEPIDWKAIAAVLEEGHARALRAALNLDEVDLRRIDPALASDLIKARNDWREAQREERAPLPAGITSSDLSAIELHRQRWQRLSESHAEFERVRDTIRKHYPQFLTPEIDFKDIAEAVTVPDEALVYLAANEKAGLALILTHASDGTPEIEGLPLPDLTRDRVNVLLFGTEVNPLDYRPHPSVRPTHGYYYAQINDPLEPLRRWGRSMAEVSHRLRSVRSRTRSSFEESTFWRAIQSIVTQHYKNLTLMAMLDKPFDALNSGEHATLSALFSQELLKIELPPVLEELGKLGLTRLAQRLAEKKIHKVGLVPYGRLGLFPLPAVQVATDGGSKRLGERFDTAIAPSARAYRASKERAEALRFETRPAIMLVGDPEPAPGAREKPLPSAAAEVGAISRIAKKYAEACTPAERARHGLAAIGIPLVGAYARKSAVVDGFATAWFADLAAHGLYRSEAPLQSKIYLAHGETITLEEYLTGAIPVRGVRLIILSACEQSIIDVREAENEAVGMPTGLIQAGVAGVLAPLWAVDDRATFLLMTRFSELYLDPTRGWSPARALAEAQRWLREEATNAVLANYEPVLTLEERLHAPLTASGKRSLRSGSYDIALGEIHDFAHDGHPEVLPYANPFYWAGFMITGS